MRPKAAAQPSVKSQITMWRHQGRIVIGRFRVDVVPTRRLDRDNDIAEAVNGKQKSIPDDEGIGFRRPPAFRHLILHLNRQRGEKGVIVGQGIADAAGSLVSVDQGIGRTGGQAGHQRLCIGWRAGHLVACLGEATQHPHRAGRGIQANAIADAGVLVWIVGQNQRDMTLSRRGLAQGHPIGGEIGGKRDPVGHRLIGDDRAFGQGVEMRLGLERHGPGQQTPIDLRKRHVHRDITGRKAGDGFFPSGPVTAREDHLDDRAIGSVERSFGTRRSGFGNRKTGGVEDHRRVRLGQHGGDQFSRACILEAGYVNRQRIEAAIRQRTDQSVNRLQISGLNQCPIKDDGGGGPGRLPMCSQILQPWRLQTRPVEPGSHQRRRFGPQRVPANQGSGMVQQRDGVVDAAMHKVTPDPLHRLRRQGRLGHQRGVGLIVTGNEC